MKAVATQTQQPCDPLPLLGFIVSRVCAEDAESISLRQALLSKPLEELLQLARAHIASTTTTTTFFTAHSPPAMPAKKQNQNQQQPPATPAPVPPQTGP